MKSNKVTIIRALFAMLVGVLLIMFPDVTTKYLVVVIGLMFLVPGLISIVYYYPLAELKTQENKYDKKVAHIK